MGYAYTPVSSLVDLSLPFLPPMPSLWGLTFTSDLFCHSGGLWYKHTVNKNVKIYGPNFPSHLPLFSKVAKQFWSKARVVVLVWGLFRRYLSIQNIPRTSDLTWATWSPRGTFLLLLGQCSHGLNNITWWVRSGMQFRPDLSSLPVPLCKALSTHLETLGSRLPGFVWTTHEKPVCMRTEELLRKIILRGRWPDRGWVIRKNFPSGWQWGSALWLAANWIWRGPAPAKCLIPQRKRSAYKIKRAFH